jgi:hypothetical protein
MTDSTLEQEIEVQDPFVTDDSSDVSGIEEVVTDTDEEESNGVTSKVDWQAEAKKFQSMKDKAEAKSQALEHYQPVIDLLEGRPDLVGIIQENLNPQVEQKSGKAEEAITEEDFNPWDAFFRPDSQSYRHREALEGKRVDDAMNRHLGALQEQVFVGNLVNELRSTYKMSEGEARDFIEFYAQPKDQLSVDTLVDVFQRTQGKGGSKPSSSLDAVRASKSVPKTAGAVSSSGSIPRNETDKVFDIIVDADNKGRIF